MFLKVRPLTEHKLHEAGTGPRSLAAAALAPTAPPGTHRKYDDHPHPEDTQRITELPVKPLPWSIQAITNLHMIFLSIAAATLVLSFRREVKGKKQKEEKEKLAQAILFSTFSPIN